MPEEVLSEFRTGAQNSLQEFVSLNKLLVSVPTQFHTVMTFRLEAQNAVSMHISTSFLINFTKDDALDTRITL